MSVTRTPQWVDQGSTVFVHHMDMVSVMALPQSGFCVLTRPSLSGFRYSHGSVPYIIKQVIAFGSC